MNVSLPKVGRRSTILLTTLAIIVGAFAYYFLVHVQTNESQFIDRSYRVLDRKVKNIQNKHSGYNNYLKFVYTSVKDEMKNTLKGESDREIEKLETKISNLYAKMDQKYYQEDYSDDSPRVQRKKSTVTYNDIYELELKLEELKAKNRSQLQSKVGVIIQKALRQAAPETVKLNSYYISENGLYDYGDISSEFSWTFFDDDGSYFTFSEATKAFIEPMLKNGLFDEYILIKKGEELDYSEYGYEEYEEPKGAEAYSIIYQSVDNLIDLESISPILQDRNLTLKVNERASLDSLFLQRGPKTVKPLDVSFFNNAYKLLFHRFKIDGVEYYLGGFVKNSVYKKESQKVEAFFLILAILMVLLLLIAMPVLKLVFMSAIERLHISNVIMTGGSIVLGVPIVLLLVFNIHIYLVEGGDKVDTQLRALSDNIEDEFKKELGTILNVLTKSNEQVKTSWDNIKEIDTLSYPAFNHIFWVNHEGVAEKNKQRSMLDLQANDIPVQTRAYFRNIVADNMWRFTNEKEETDQRFFIESIVSWTDFTNEAAISIPTDLEDYPVAVLTTQLHSVMNPILPQGFGFAIIDQDGYVKFHSDQHLILQENFLEETNKYSNLQAGIYSRIALNANIKYHNINHRAYMQPINAMPLYIVTFFNNEYRNAEIQGVVSISMILLFGSFGVVALMVLVLFLIQKRRSKLKIKGFLFHWMRPDDEKLVPYQFLLVVFLIIGAINVLAISTGKVSEQEILFSFIITNAYLFLISYSWLSPKHSIRYTERPTERRNFHIAFVLVIAVADITYAPFYGGSFWWIAYQIILFLIYKFGEEFRALVVTQMSKVKPLKWLEQIVRKHAYNIFLFSWVLISSILPIFYIYMVAHNEENIIWQKYNQLEIANEYHDKVKMLSKRVASIKDVGSARATFFNEKLNNGKYLLETKLQNQPVENLANCASGSSRSDRVLSEIRPHYNELIVDSKGLAFDVSQEGNRQWCFPSPGNKSSMQLHFKDNFIPSGYEEYQNIYVYGNNDLIGFTQGGVVKSAEEPKIEGAEKEKKPSLMCRIQAWSSSLIPSKYFALFFLTVTLILIGVYKLIEYCTNKIYGRQYDNFKNTLPLTVANFKKISIGDDSITHSKQRQIFLLGLPKSNKSNLLNSIEENLFKVDMIHMNQTEKWKEILNADLKKFDGVILENFEYGVSSHQANVRRLQLLEELLIHDVQHLFISSNVHPSFITEFYEAKILGTKDLDENLKEEYLLALETWRHILGGFILVHNPIKENMKINSFLKPSWIKNSIFKQLFIKELNKGSFLPNLLPALKDYYVKLKKNEDGCEERIDKEDMILRIQMLAESYYMGLWNTLSKEERYIIYDLAKDRFVNINNQNGIRSLLEKGLLVYDNELRIMNESFTNFVLSIIKKEEALMMEKEVRDKGTWSTISAVLGMAVLGIIAFLFLGNPDFFHDFNALISALVAVIGILPRVGGLLSFGKRNADVPV